MFVSEETTGKNSEHEPGPYTMKKITTVKGTPERKLLKQLKGIQE